MNHPWIYTDRTPEALPVRLVDKDHHIDRRMDRHIAGPWRSWEQPRTQIERPCRNPRPISTFRSAESHHSSPMQYGAW